MLTQRVQENGSPLKKSQHITVPPRLPQVGKGDGHTLYVKQRDSHSVPLNSREIGRAHV